ncbi:unnamed protein product, partial [Angiostrongylus costaricensis]|uniref:Neprilysin n=1 Tax=Angiostrongylus costaricensis TaxID=334426 RepID=A0A0R3PFX7_ANGCS
VDPCVDFFEFTCGNWKAKHPIPSNRISYSQLDVLSDEIQVEMKVVFESKEVSLSKSTSAVKVMYRKCMDKDELNRIGARKLIETIKSYGEWPMLEGNKWSPDQFDLTTLLVDIAAVRGADIFITNYIALDSRNVSRRFIEFNQGELGLGGSTRDYYLDRGKHGKIIAAYRQFLISKVKLFHEDADLIANVGRIASDVDEIIELETELAKILVAEEDRRNFTKMYNLRRLSDMQTLMPLVDWARYFYSVAPFAVNHYLAKDPQILITEIDYMRRVTDLINSTDPRIITNYAYIRYSSSWGGELGERKSQESKNVTLQVINDLQDAFHNMVVENSWMDKATKARALDKARHMLRQIGYPDFILDDQKVDDYYNGLYIKESDSYSEMVEKLSRWSIELDFNLLLKPVDRSEFDFNPVVVNAFYSSTSNSIKFPAAILQAPFFHQTFPKALNYGGIGAVIGHEITHGFDDQGRQFDAIGNLRDWWDGKVKDKFEKRAQCIIDQYDKIEVPETGLRVNGKLTQGENIADNGGVKQAFKHETFRNLSTASISIAGKIEKIPKAYKKYLKKCGKEKRIKGLEKYNNEQMFFIGYGTVWCGHSTTDYLISLILTDPHAPEKYRVNRVLANQPEFAAAFNCPVGTPMNPTERCAVW